MVSRKDIVNETHDFINRSQRTYGYQLDIRSQYPRLPRGLRYTNELVQAIKAEHPELTGVLGTALPMIISVPDIDGHRLQVTMLVTPESLNRGKVNITGTSYTRQGWINQLWGSAQDTISANGKTVAFMTDGVGMTTFFRTQTFGYLNFMALMNAYKNNGYRMTDPANPTLRDNVNVISLVYGVEIFYDNNFFMGHFNNFTLDEDAEKPFLFSYNFEFIVSASSDDYSEVRGHFDSLKPRQDSGTVFPPELDVSTDKLALTGNDIQLVRDAMKKPPKTPIRDGKPRNDEFLYKLWERITQLPWSEAVKRGYTDGSSKRNLWLRRALLEKTWPFAPDEVIRK